MKPATKRIVPKSAARASAGCQANRGNRPLQECAQIYIVVHLTENQNLLAPKNTLTADSMTAQFDMRPHGVGSVTEQPPSV